MPHKDPQARRDYQNERYRKKKETKKRELDVLDKLGTILLSRRLTGDEEKIYNVLSEKYDAEIHSKREREKRITQPTDDSDIAMYQHTSQDERIIAGEGAKSNDTVLISPFPPTPPTENTPKVRLSSQSKEWWINPKTGEWEPKPKMEDSGNVVDSPWKFKSIYMKN